MPLREGLEAPGAGVLLGALAVDTRGREVGGDEALALLIGAVTDTQVTCVRHLLQGPLRFLTDDLTHPALCDPHDMKSPLILS